MQQDLELNTCLVLEFLLVPDDLDGDDLTSLMINALQGLAKRSFAQEVDDLEPVCDLILEYDVVVAPLIVVAAIILVVLAALDLLGSETQEVARLVVQDLALLVLGEPWPLQVMLQDLRPTQWQLWLICFDLLPLFSQCFLLTQ